MFPEQEKAAVVRLKKNRRHRRWDHRRVNRPHLAQLEYDIVIIEQNEPASGATGSAFGWLTGAVSDDAPDMFLRRAALADWHRLEEQIQELQINWCGSLKYDAIPQACLPDEHLLHRAEIASLEPALIVPPQQPAMRQKMAPSTPTKQHAFY